MSWTTFMHGQSVVSFTSGIVTVVGGISGLIAAGQQINKRNFVNKFGPTHYEKDWMGYFVMEVPPWFKALVQPVPQPPKLPTITGLISAADDGLFTSSMIAWMRPGYQRVSWLALYEAFFLEYVWDSLQAAREPPLLADDFSIFVDRAREEVQKVIHKAENGTASTHTSLELRQRIHMDRVTVSNIAKILWKFMRYAWFLATWVSRALCSTWVSVMHHVCCPAKRTEATAATEAHHVGTISPLVTEIPNIDPHLLYYRWEASPTYDMAKAQFESNVEAPNKKRLGQSVGPLLVKSSKRLKQFQTAVWTPYRPLTWSEVPRKLWTYKGKPCLAIFQAELASLALFLGIQIKRRGTPDHGPEGMGAFGTVLVSEEDAYTCIRLIYEPGQEARKAGGSGYSMLFARHMVCGCLPFAQTTSEDKGIVVHTAVVTRDTIGSAKLGVPFDSLGRPPNAPFPPSVSSSGFATTDYCFPTEETDRNGVFEGKLSFWDGGTEKASGTWSDAVAGIAFGGLVPMATQPLIELVQYVVGGKLDQEEEISAFFHVMVEICEHAKRRVKGVAGSIPLFGSRFDAMRVHLGRTSPAKVWLSAPLDMDTVVWLFSLYTTLLEYLIAAIQPDEANADTTAAANPAAPPIQNGEIELAKGSGHTASTSPSAQVQQVFEECKKQIARHYNYAIADSRSSTGSTCPTDGTATAADGEISASRSNSDSNGRMNGPGTAQNVMDIQATLERIQERLKDDEAITKEDCGSVARCTIMAWAALVRSVSWGKGGEKGEEEAGNVLLPVEALPHIAAWE